VESEVVEVEGHIIDSLILAKILDLILAAGCDYRDLDVDIGRTAKDPSRARIELSAPDAATLERLLAELHVHGANRAAHGDAQTAPVEVDGVLPAGFYSTTNLATWVSLDGHWWPVDRDEMDCALVVRWPETGGPPTVSNVPMHRARVGDQVVLGSQGVRVKAPERRRAGPHFEFMDSDVSSEKPKALFVAQVAEHLRQVRAAQARILVVAGPALIHTGAGPALARMVRDGWVDVLFAGNGFATHDMEANVLGTSLGVPVRGGQAPEGGHANHLRVINEVRRHGSIAAAVSAGYVGGGVMYECVRRGVPFVLGGSVRDDGPLPDVHTDVIEAADAMRAALTGVGAALICASTLHAIATGNLLPASVETFCVDINPAVVTKLADRGSHQALGIVTDVGLFVGELADALCGR
jgi:lysine-ketoglutarate reductase/saccharopine dehydrogenase-like protein (TIGR00300 family)